MQEALKYYMGLPYSRVIEEKNEISGHYFMGCVKELPGCWCIADTREELYSKLDEVMEGWFEVQLENDLPIPEPVSEGCSLVTGAKRLFRSMSTLEQMEVLYCSAKYLVENPTSILNHDINEIYNNLATLVRRIDFLASNILKEYTYVAVFTPEDNGMFSVNFPDLEGCYTCGDNKEDAVKSAKDVLAMSILGYIEDGKVLPMPAKARDIKCTDVESRIGITVNLREYIDSL